MESMTGDSHVFHDWASHVFHDRFSGISGGLFGLFNRTNSPPFIGRSFAVCRQISQAK